MFSYLEIVLYEMHTAKHCLIHNLSSEALQEFNSFKKRERTTQIFMYFGKNHVGFLSFLSLSEYILAS